MSINTLDRFKTKYDEYIHDSVILQNAGGGGLLNEYRFFTAGRGNRGANLCNLDSAGMISRGEAMKVYGIFFTFMPATTPADLTLFSDVLMYEFLYKGKTQHYMPVRFINSGRGLTANLAPIGAVADYTRLGVPTRDARGASRWTSPFTILGEEEFSVVLHIDTVAVPPVAAVTVWCHLVTEFWHSLA